MELNSELPLIKSSSAQVDLESSHKKLRFIDLGNALLASFSLTLAYYEVIAKQNDSFFEENYYPTQDIERMRWLGVVLTVFLCNSNLGLLLVFRYHFDLDIKKQEKQHFREATLVSSGVLGPLCLELVICSVTTYPYFNSTFSGSMLHGDYTYSLNDILFLLMLLRFYLVVRAYKSFSRWTESASKKFCSRFSVEPNLFFSVKSDLKERPFQVIMVSFVSCLVIIGTAIRISERSYVSGVTAEGLEHLTNVQWLLVISMTSVGYGDLYPSTHLGRFFTSVACIFGMLLVSVLVIFMGYASDFDKNQRVAYLKVKGAKSSFGVQKAAGKVICQLLVYKSKQTLPQKLQESRKLKERAKEFLEVLENSKQLNYSYDEMLYDLSMKMEKKLFLIRKSLTEVPNFQERISYLNQQMEEFLNCSSEVLKTQS